MIFRRILFALCSLVATATSTIAQSVLQVPVQQPTIQAAINAGVDGTTIIVAPGTYFENLNFGGKQIALTSSGGAAVTILDGSHNPAPAIAMPAGTANHRVIYPTTVDGFTIRNGGLGPATKQTGGIYDQVDASITHNILTGNHCAGIIVDYNNTLVQGNEVDNTLDAAGDCPAGGGSGILVISSGGGSVSTIPLVTIRGNTIQNNTQGGQQGVGAGGISVLGFQALVQNNIVRGNASAGIGGGLYLGNLESVYVVGNLFAANTAACGGGGIATARTPPSGGTFLFANNTIADNAVQGACASSQHAGNATQIVLGDEGSKQYPTVFANNIVSSNARGAQPLIACGLTIDDPAAGYNTPLFDHTLFGNGTAAIVDKSCVDPTGSYGNLTANPQFAPATYTPLPASPAIDAGNNSVLAYEQAQSAVNIDITLDLAGNARVADATARGYGIIDIGAYEFAGVAGSQASAITLRPVGFSMAESIFFSATGGDVIDLLATVPCAAGGSVGAQGPIAYFEDGKPLGTAPLVAYTAQATWKGIFLDPGVRRFTARYGGQDPCHPGVSLQLLYFVRNYQPRLALASSSSPSRPGQAVTFSVALTSPDPKQTGSVTLTDNGAPLATLTLDASGKASYTTSALPLGTHTILASYTGDATHDAASASLQQTVQTPALTGSLAASPEPSYAGALYTITLTLTPTAGGATPTGTVQFMLNGAALGGPVAVTPSGSGSNTAFASLTDNTPRLPGTYALTATYAGDSNYAPQPVFATSHVVVLSPTTITLVASTPTTLFYGQPADGLFTLHVLNGNFPANGTYTLQDNGVDVPLCTALAVGVTCPYGNPVLLDAGVHAFTIHYLGDAYNGPSLSPPLVFSVLPDLTTATLTSSLNPAFQGDPVRFNVAITGNVVNPLNGVVTFLDNGVPFGGGSLGIAGSAGLTTTQLAVGTHRITVVYPGSKNFNPATSAPLSQRIDPRPITLASNITLTSNLNPSAPTQAVTITAAVQVSGALAVMATGTVTFTVDGAASGGPVALDGFGLARLQLTNLTPGSHAITASYAGASGTGGTPVKPPSPAPPVRSNATTAPVATILPSVSAPFTQVVTTALFQLAPGFDLMVTPVPVTVDAGRTAVLIATSHSFSGYQQPLTLACIGLPYEMTCTFGNATIPAGGGSTTLSLTPAAPHDCGDPTHPYLAGDTSPRLPIGMTIAAAGALLVWFRRRTGRKLRRMTGLLCLLMGTLSFVGGCGGHCTDLGVRPGDYTFTVSATPVGGPITQAKTQLIHVTVTIP